MKNRMKWFGVENELGIQRSSTFGTCFSYAKKRAKALGKVGSKEEHALKLCDIFPPSDSIMNLAPYMGTSSKAIVVDFHDQVSNLCLSRVNTNNVHHLKPTFSKY